MSLHASASPRATVDKFALSARAKAELIEIYDHSATQFGPYQAEAYLAPIGSPHRVQLVDHPRYDRQSAVPEFRVLGIEPERRQQLGVMLGAAG
jgi:plasmid stabilization system protein ParE